MKFRWDVTDPMRALGEDGQPYVTAILVAPALGMQLGRFNDAVNQGKIPHEIDDATHIKMFNPAKVRAALGVKVAGVNGQPQPDTASISEKVADANRTLCPAEPAAHEAPVPGGPGWSAGARVAHPGTQDHSGQSWSDLRGAR